MARHPLVAAATALALTFAAAPAASAHIRASPKGAAAEASTTGTVFVADTRGRDLSEIDAATGAVTGTISIKLDRGIGRDPTNETVAPDGKHIYVVAAGNADVSVIDGSSDRIVRTIPTCRDTPGPLVFTPDGTQAYLPCGHGDHGLGVIDIATGKFSKVPVSGTVEYLKVSPDGSKVYASVPTGLVVIDTATNRVATTIATSPAPGPVVVSADSSTVYAPIGTGVAVIEAVTGTVTETIPVTTGADKLTLSPDGDQLYVAGDSSHVAVISTLTNAVTATVPLTAGLGAASVTLSPDGSLGYVITTTTGEGGPTADIEVIDTATETVSATIPLADTASVVIFSSDGRRAYVGSQGAAAVNVVNTTTSKVIATVGMPGAQATMVLADQGRRLYVLNGSYDYGAAGVWVIDASTADVIATIAPSEQHSGEVAVSPDGTKAFVVGFGLLWAVDTVTGTATAMPMGMLPSAIVFSPDGTQAYETDDYGNSVQIIDTGTNRVVGSIAIPTGLSPLAFTSRYLAIAPNGKTLFVSDGTSVHVIDTATDTVTGAFTTPSPGAMAVTPNGRTLYVSDAGGADVSAIDIATRATKRAVAVSSRAISLAVTPDGSEVYVVGSNSSVVSVISTAAGKVTATITVGSGTSDDAVAFSADGTEAFVSNGNSGTVSVIDVASGAVTSTIAVGKVPTGIAVGP